MDKQKVIEQAINKHRPAVNLKSFCTEVLHCRCGLVIHETNNESWREWSAHVAKEVYKAIDWDDC